ncbi:metallophosphoesterase family protein [Oerskovia flava]|uniref:metallophosphoesterase family protein n=1 Tax=Oerskovia flava TaxID=2986422 RepID=UPI00223F51BF|nr:metallophosphoesterase family protein [Oerskovia sp. JB1-3-2]
MAQVGTVAVLSDVHGVLPVLDAVLATTEVRAAEFVVVTGDHCSGPQPREVLDRLRNLGDRVVLVRGNADRELVAVARGAEIDVPDPIVPWAASQLRPVDVEVLDALPHPVELSVRGFGPVVFCHGTPRDDEEVVLVDTRIDRWVEAFAGLRDEVRTVVCGHTHMPFVRLVDRRLVVNPGSIGMPYGRPGGSFAILRDGAVGLHHVDVDVAAVSREIVEACDYPDVQEWVEQFVASRASDAEALHVFGPRDGR